MINEKVVCITKDDCYISTLTYGKIYDATWDENEPIYSPTGLYLTITNDIGVKAGYHEKNFITIKKWRELKLNKIID